MFKRLKITAGVLGAFAALGFGGAAIAGATSSAPAIKAPVSAPATEVTSGVDGDTIQRGDQNTPDTASAALTASTGATDTAGATDTSATDTAAGEAPDTATEASTPESTTPESTTPESATSEAATPNDGPGGYADTSATADTQQQGAK